jgi:hypothetical protein
MPHLRVLGSTVTQVRAQRSCCQVCSSSTNIPSHISLPSVIESTVSIFLTSIFCINSRLSAMGTSSESRPLRLFSHATAVAIVKIVLRLPYAPQHSHQFSSPKARHAGTSQPIQMVIVVSDAVDAWRVLEHGHVGSMGRTGVQMSGRWTSISRVLYCMGCHTLALPSNGEKKMVKRTSTVCMYFSRGWRREVGGYGITPTRFRGSHAEERRHGEFQARVSQRATMG